MKLIFAGQLTELERIGGELQAIVSKGSELDDYLRLAHQTGSPIRIVGGTAKVEKRTVTTNNTVAYVVREEE